MLCSSSRRRVTRVVNVASALLGLATLANLAFAAPLNLSSTHPGDVTTHYSSVSYVLDANPLTGNLTVTGEPDEFDVNSQFIWNGVFSLSMTVMRSSGAVVSGSVSISGDMLDGPTYSGLSLQGDITDFGFQDPPFNPGLGEGSVFEFVVHVNGGELHAPYYTDDTAGIITVLELLIRTNARAKSGLLWDANSNGSFGTAESLLRSQALSLFSSINNT